MRLSKCGPARHIMFTKAGQFGLLLSVLAAPALRWLAVGGQ